MRRHPAPNNARQKRRDLGEWWRKGVVGEEGECVVGAAAAAVKEREGVE